MMLDSFTRGLHVPATRRTATRAQGLVSVRLSCTSEHWGVWGGAKSARNIMEAEPIFPFALENCPAFWVHKDPGWEDRTLDSMSYYVNS